MIGDDALGDDRVDSLTIRHLREIRRTQDMFLDLLKRQTEMTGRLARDVSELKLEIERSFNEVKSDLLLLENRSITSAENDEYFRRRFDEVVERLDRIESKSKG
jgi:hypothetical protein